MTARPVLLVVALLAAGQPLAGQSRPTFWDLRLGAAAAELPRGFIEFACGTNGGPPGRPITGFTKYAECPADDRGWHEVQFRYDDEAEYLARALEQTRAIERFAGTEVFGIPVIVSAMFDGSGELVGLRLATDPRGAEPGRRNDHWTLAGTLMRHFGSDGWTCEALPPAMGETPVSSYFVKDHCTKATTDMEFSAEREYYHRRGQYFVDEFGKVQPDAFTSAARFEVTDRYSYSPGLGRPP